MHAHPLLTVTVMTGSVLAVFFWALFAGSHDEPQDELQVGGDWAWPAKSDEEQLLFAGDRANARAAAHEALARRAQKQRELDEARRAA